MCAEDAKNSHHSGLAEDVANDDENDESIHSSRPRGAKILAHGCCPGLVSKSRLYTY